MSEITKALVTIQGQLTNPALDGTNPHYHSKYVTLPSLLDHVKAVAKLAGVAVVQEGYAEDGLIGVRTILIHESGEERDCGVLAIPNVADPQRAGSAITYLRRYALASVFGIAGDEDDDANAASPPQRQQSSGQRQGDGSGGEYPASDKQVKYLFSLAREKGKSDPVQEAVHRKKEELGIIPSKWVSAQIDRLKKLPDAGDAPPREDAPPPSDADIPW